mgnify:CR=1 FL=1
MRLPDLYYTRQFFDGYPEPPGVQAPIQFYVGEDVIFDKYMAYEGKPVLEEDWDLTATVKTNAMSQCVMWTGILNNGIYKNNNSGYYKFVIPSQDTDTWQAGTYWLEVVAREKLGRGTGPKDIDVFLFKQPFGLDFSINSSNPTHAVDNVSERTTPNIVDPKQL